MRVREVGVGVNHRAEFALGPRGVARRNHGGRHPVPQRRIVGGEFQSAPERLDRSGPILATERLHAERFVGDAAVEHHVGLLEQRIGQIGSGRTASLEQRVRPFTLAGASIRHGKRIVNHRGARIAPKRLLKVSNGLVVGAAGQCCPSGAEESRGGVGLARQCARELRLCLIDLA